MLDSYRYQKVLLGFDKFFFINGKAWGSSLVWTVQIRTPNWYEDKSVVIKSYGRMFFSKCQDKGVTSPCAGG